MSPKGAIISKVNESFLPPTDDLKSGIEKPVRFFPLLNL